MRAGQFAQRWAHTNVNHVKLIPHHSNSIGDGESTKHKGYGFLFMMDYASAVAVEACVNAFPNNKVEMMERTGVFVKRHDEQRRGVGGVIDVGNSSNAGRNVGNNDDVTENFGQGSY